MNTKLHVLFLCGWYPSRVLTNNGDFIERHAKAVSKLHKVTVFHIISDKNNTKNIEITYKQSNNIETYIAYIKSTNNTLLKGILFVVAFLKLMRKTPPIDIIHLNEIYPLGLFCLYLKKVKKIPFIISEHWTGYLKHQYSFSRTKKRVIKMILNSSGRFCPVSYHLKEAIEDLTKCKTEFSIIPNVVNTSIFKPKENKNPVFTVLHISNMKDEHKNISEMLEALAIFKNKGHLFKIILLGDESYRYEKLANTLNIKDNIVFLDHITHSRVVTFLQKADVLLLFSNYENLPCVILESFACGTPVISTDVGGIREFFPEDFGRLIPKQDKKVLVETLEMFSEKKISIATKDQMHEYAEQNFSYQKIAQQFSEIYWTLVKKEISS